MMKPGDPFWMVCAMPTHPGSSTQPRLRYPHIDEARRAAQDLAYQNGKPFVILEAVEVIRPKDTFTRSLF